MRAVIVGGSAAGLLTALLLVRDGHSVIVVEREDIAPAADPDEAAETAFRPTAPQIVQPHGVLSLCWELLRERLPDVAAAVPDAGIVELDFRGQLPPGLACEPRPGDERLVTLRTRRSTFDWVVRRAAATQTGIDWVQSTVRSLVVTQTIGEVPVVSGVETDAGRFAADLVVDASGRRGGIDDRLQRAGARPAAFIQAECGLAYYSRHYRLTTTEGLPAPATTRLLAELDHFTAGIWGGDNGTMQMAVVPLVEDKRFRAVTDPDVYSSVLRLVSPLALWLDVLEPITGIFPMGGLHNTLRRLVDDAGPVVGGCVCVGDAVCCTNPTLGRGLSLALQNAVDLVDTLRLTGGDPLETVSRFDATVPARVEPFFVDQARIDERRLRTLRANHAGVAPPPLSPEPDRLTMAELRVAAPHDATVFRAMLRLMGMLAIPDDVYRDPEVLAAARAVIRDLPPAKAMPQPDPQRLLSVLAA